MKLLFDQNLSRRLVTTLADGFPESAHVVFQNLDAVEDRVIWEFAKATDTRCSPWAKRRCPDRTAGSARRSRARRRTAVAWRASFAYRREDFGVVVHVEEVRVQILLAETCAWSVKRRVGEIEVRRVAMVATRDW